MEEFKRCASCGAVNSVAEESKPCKQCGAILQGSGGATEAVSTPSAIDSPDPPLTTEGEVDSIGAYGKAADAAWVDPTETVELEVPEEVLERHKEVEAHRKNVIGLIVGIMGVLILGVLFRSCF